MSAQFCVAPFSWKITARNSSENSQQKFWNMSVLYYVTAPKCVMWVEGDHQQRISACCNHLEEILWLHLKCKNVLIQIMPSPNYYLVFSHPFLCQNFLLTFLLFLSRKRRESWILLWSVFITFFEVVLDNCVVSVWYIFRSQITLILLWKSIFLESIHW